MTNQVKSAPATSNLALPSIALDSTPIALLRVESGVSRGTVYFIGEERRTVTIGRSLECDVPILDPQLSRTHVQINVFPRHEDGAPKRTYAFELVDSGSRNGTFVNGNRMDKYPLQQGDLIQVGGVEIRFTRLA